MYRLGFNPTAGPVVIDAEGRTLAGGEWGPVDSTAAEVRSAAETGALILQDEPGDEAGDAPRNGWLAVGRAEEARATLDGLDRADLADLARRADLLGADDPDPTKSELVAMLAPRGITPPPSSPPAPARGARKSQEA
jgi:hypothetical protein